MLPPWVATNGGYRGDDAPAVGTGDEQNGIGHRHTLRVTGCRRENQGPAGRRRGDIAERGVSVAMTSLTMLCTDGSEIANEALAAGLRVLAPADRTLVVTVVEPVDASLMFGASGLAGGMIDEQEYVDMVGAGRDAAEAILRGTVTALGLDGLTTVETALGRGPSRPGVVRSGRRAWCDGPRRRNTRPRRAAACSAGLGVRLPGAQRSVSGPRCRREWWLRLVPVTRRRPTGPGRSLPPRR